MYQSSYLCRIGTDDRLSDFPQAEPAQHQAMALGRADRAALQGDADALSRRFRGFCRGHDVSTPARSSPRRNRMTSSGFLSCVRPSSVARTVLNGVPRPNVLEMMLWAPASSTTARTAPPAMMPVPSTAGFKRTCSPPNRPWTSCGMVPDLSVTWTRFFLACCTAFAMATGTSAALPLPMPTQPCPSPTTTSAQKLKRLPPLTTLATRLMNTTLSLRLSSSGLTRTLVLPSILELQSAFAGGIRQRLDPAVIQPATAVKDDFLDLGTLCAIGQERAHGFGRDDAAGGLQRLPQGLVQRRGSRQRRALEVVDDLRIDMAAAAIDIEPRTLIRSEDALTNTLLAPGEMR